MPQRNHTVTRDSATESKFYLPAGRLHSPVATRMESLWTTLFSHRV